MVIGRDLQHTPQWGDPGRSACAGARPEIDHVVSAATDAPSLHTGSAAAMVYPDCRRTLSQTRRAVLPRASVGNVSWMRIVPIAGGHDGAIAPEPRNFLAARQPGSNTRRDSAESLESVGGLHALRMHGGRRDVWSPEGSES